MAARYNTIARACAAGPAIQSVAGLGRPSSLRPVPRPITAGALLAFAACAPSVAWAQASALDGASAQASRAANAEEGGSGRGSATPSTPASDTVAIAQVKFDDDLLMRPKGGTIDVSRFERGQIVAPGTYRVDLFRNGEALGRVAVTFSPRTEAASAVPCFDLAIVRRLGLDMAAVARQSPQAVAAVTGGQCVTVESLVPGATSTFDVPNLRLDLSIEQVALERNPNGYVSPELWDSGVPTATLAYNANWFHTSAGGMATDQLYLGLTGGVNLGDWHFRTQGALNSATRGGTHYQDIATYVERDLPSIRSQLTLGDSFTDGAVFDSIGMQGAQLGTSDQMLPDSMRGYAPVIRGVAMTNARVTVTQNGNIIYATNVPPGAFKIDDVYPTGHGGNLVVTVTEADGAQRSYTVPYASVVQLLRPGIARFNVAVGRVRDTMLHGHPGLFQATWQQGINNYLTGYAGAIAADGYLAGLVGGAVNTPIGAVALDVTRASATIAGAAHTGGESLRLSYSKTVQETGTQLSLAAYRYSSRGFWPLRDALLARQAVASGTVDRIDRQRDQLQLSLNQSLGDQRGSVYFVGSRRNYWNRGGSDLQFEFGYSNTLRVHGYNMGYSVQVSRERTAWTNRLDNQVFATLTLPLSRSAQAPLASLNIGHSSQGGTTSLATVAGALGEHNQFAYGINANRTGGDTGGGVQAQYSAQAATISTSLSAGTGYTQFGAGLSGALVAHPGGVTLTNSLADTAGIVEAKGAAGAHVQNWPGVEIDSRGYAVLPYLQPYHMNTVVLDPKGLPYTVELMETSQQVAPRANAISLLRFETKEGQSALLTLRQKDGSAVPFGAEVDDATGHAVASVGQGGVVYLQGVNNGDRYTAHWGRKADESCRFSMRVKVDENSPYATSTVTCEDDAQTADAADLKAEAAQALERETAQKPEN